MADLTISVTDAQLTRIKDALTINGGAPDTNGVVSVLKNYLKDKVRKYEEAVATESVSELDI